ncbi:MAG: hypothetical protein AB1735_08105 [Pseudomonadota bacterium]|jgi:F0F1-type ATP synthase assembly protein I
MATPADWTRTLAASFVRGSIATAIVAALQEQRQGEQLLKSAALGGAALSAAVAVEQLIFNQEPKMGKKKKKGGKNKANAATPDLAAMQAWLQAQTAQPTGLAALTPSQQLLAGVLVGAALAWVLGDEALRAKLLRAGMQLYGSVAGGLEEVKEQMADIQAELEAQRANAA